MDPVTHAASGVVALLALPSRPATLWSIPVAALACASPDIDLAFIHTPLQFLQLHRGITHSFAFSPVLGLALALLAWPLWRSSTPGSWKFPLVWLFCIGMIWLHIWLDIVTTYGTMVFLPFSSYRVRLNSIYIIDLLITIPLLWAIFRWRTRPGLMLAALAWVFIYPAVGIAANIWHTSQWNSLLATKPDASGKMVVLPDAFAPLFWRVLYEEHTPQGTVVCDQSIDFLGNARATPFKVPAATSKLVEPIARSSIAGQTYFDFALLPVEGPLPEEDKPTAAPESATYKMFYDLRFGSGLEFIRELLAMRPNAEKPPFQLLAEFLPENGATPAPEQIRLRFTDSGRDSQWHRPVPPEAQSFWEWLVGIRN